MQVRIRLLNGGAKRDRYARPHMRIHVKRIPNREFINRTVPNIQEIFTNFPSQILVCQPTLDQFPGPDAHSRVCRLAQRGIPGIPGHHATAGHLNLAGPSAKSSLHSLRHGSETEIRCRIEAQWEVRPVYIVDAGDGGRRM